MDGHKDGVDVFYLGLGSQIRHFRDKRRMTQQTLGEKVGLTRTSLTNIEKGRQKVLAHTLSQIAASLGVSTDELIPHSENELEKVLRQGHFSEGERQLIKTALQPIKRRKP